MRKIIALGIMLLFLGMTISSSTGFNLEKQSTIDVITVDDEGDGDYTSIKDALSNANSGDTIEVYSGTYFEHDIAINIEGISLKGIPHELGNGSDVGKPFINGEGNSRIFHFNASNITLDGFIMDNEGGADIVDISISADGCIISNNNLSNTNSCFIYVKGSNTKIINNTIHHSSMRQGICLRDPSNNNTVRSNLISDCDTGILTWGSGYNLIEGNTVQYCDGYGIDIAGYDNNIIRYNTVSNCWMGLELSSIDSIVSNNNFMDNEIHASGFNNRFSWLISNKWTGNYWGRGRILPYPIFCQVFIFPWIQFDWRPAQEPYDIGV